MLKFSSIEIINFKSIKDYLIEIDDFTINNSTIAFLVGLNESGKSTFLEAISLINKGLEEIDYETYCNIDSQDDDKYIELYVAYRVTDLKLLRNKLSESTLIDVDLIKDLQIKSIYCDIYKNQMYGANRSYSLDFDDIDYDKFAIRETKKNTGGVQKIINKIEKISNIPQGEAYKKLDKENLETFLEIEIEKFILQYLPIIQLWKPSSEFLINDTINLNEFKENPEISIPLRNIFNIYGKKTNESIKDSIEKALKTPSKRDKLQDELSESITKYVNKVWREHKIKIKISINHVNCDVLIEDKDKKYSYFNMQQRSDGFRQFISLILSLSTLNESQFLKNNIILIDEPEVHLHPSGIIYMREELLKIAKNNVIFISTHSQFLIDINNPRRQFIVKKEKGESHIQQVTENTNFKEDIVLKNAFGLNLYKELLPEKIIIVEGSEDKDLLYHLINLYNKNRNYTIKSAGGASKVPGFASLLSGEDIQPYIIFDSDKEGKDNKKKILNTFKEYYNNNNVFLLKEVNKNLPDNSTIEDLYPIKFIEEFLFNEIGEKFNLNTNEAIIIQLKNQSEELKTNKQKMDSIKLRLSKEFIKNYDTLDKLNTIEKLTEFAINLQLKINTQ